MSERRTLWARRVAAATGAVALTFVGMPVAHAAPRPRNEEWWFSTWDVEKRVWPLTTGRGVTVAVLDYGVNARLPDLSGVVLPGTDLTGHKDDGRIDLDTELGGHGTAMAALIAGQGSAMVGIAPGAKILPITTDRASSHVDGDDAQADGIRYAVKHGAKVISMSVVGANPEGPLKCDYYVQGAVDYAVKHDVVLVAAAGNDGDSINEHYLPAGCPGVLGVGAVDYQGKPWVKTQRQPYVAVAAPGVNAGSIGRAGVFTDNSGTSTSAALAAGAVALVRSKFPKLSAREVVRRIIASTLDTGPKGVDLQTGYGLLRPYHALTDKVPADAPNPVYARWDDEQRRPRAASVSPSLRPTPAATPRESSKSDRSSTMTFTVAGILLLCLVAGSVLFLVRRGRRPGQPG